MDARHGVVRDGGAAGHHLGVMPYAAISAAGYPYTKVKIKFHDTAKMENRLSFAVVGTAGGQLWTPVEGQGSRVSCRGIHTSGQIGLRDAGEDRTAP